MMRDIMSLSEFATPDTGNQLSRRVRRNASRVGKQSNLFKADFWRR
jgi:hypothetical protein